MNRALFLVALAVCFGCLPDRKSDEELRKEFSGDQDANAAATDVSSGGAETATDPDSETAATDVVSADWYAEFPIAPDSEDVTEVPDIAVEIGPGEVVDEQEIVDSTEIGVDAVEPMSITSCKGHCGVLLTDSGNPCSCHPSCKNTGDCCADFVVACSCPGGDAACDDQDVCTIDSCKNGYCQQIPVPGKLCCHADSDCSGGDACSVPKCQEGACTLKTTNCDDGLTCTNDVCNPQDGQCVHKLLIGQCAIDGACHKAGDYDPSSNGCSICDPGKDTSVWSPKAGTCSIGGECYKSGDVSASGTCAVCDPAKSASDWSVKSGKCAIDGVCYAIGDVDPAAPDCGVCDPTKSKFAFSLTAGYCQIDGVCAKSGAAGAGGCSSCDPANSTSAWTPKASGATCDDGSVCTTGDKCDATGTCKGAAVANCCGSDDDCKTMQAQAGDCEKAACNATSGKCAIVPVPNCCTGGGCCDIPNKTLRPKNTVCNATISAGIEYQCNGQTVEQRKLYFGCTGDSPTKCSSDTPGYGPWTATGKVCGVDETCVLGSASQPPTCKVK